MEVQKKRVITTGNGLTKTPILANGKGNTAAKSKPSTPPTSIDANNTKPVSVPEVLSMLQTQCLDLQTLKCPISILARNNHLYIIAEIPASIGKLDMGENGHILSLIASMIACISESGLCPIISSFLRMIKTYAILPPLILPVKV